MTLDSTQQRLGHSMNFNYSAPVQPPGFSDPWTSAPPQPGSRTSAMYVGSRQPTGLNPSMMPGKPHDVRSSTSGGPSMTSYGPMPIPTASAGLLDMNRMHTTSAAYGNPTYPTSASPVHGFTPASAPYDPLGGYAAAGVRQPTYAMAPEADSSRRYSHNIAEERKHFADALDASQGMLAMSQETPRNIYGNRSDRSSVDSYGFPSTHSTSSSVSSTGGNFSSYYGDSVSDYSTAGSDIESASSRTLPRPQGLMGSGMPPAPQSMMGQFSSKVSSNTQKKHKCKVCDKRFTRPSSLQTHMYSHTGEKPFACEVEGCGRNFSVVSNLRRHRKVHRGDAPSEAGSEDHHSD